MQWRSWQVENMTTKNPDLCSSNHATTPTHRERRRCQQTNSKGNYASPTPAATPQSAYLVAGMHPRRGNQRDRGALRLLRRTWQSDGVRVRTTASGGFTFRFGHTKINIAT